MLLKRKSVAKELATLGHSGEMSIIVRKSDKPYEVEISSADIALVANEEKVIPREWINERGNDVNKAFLDYVRPLVIGETEPVYKDGLPVHFEV